MINKRLSSEALSLTKKQPTWGQVFLTHSSSTLMFPPRRGQTSCLCDSEWAGRVALCPEKTHNATVGESGGGEPPKASDWKTHKLHMMNWSHLASHWMNLSYGNNLKLINQKYNGCFYKKPHFTSYGTGGIEVVGGSMERLWGTTWCLHYIQGAQNKSCNKGRAEPPEPHVHTVVRSKPRACDGYFSKQRKSHCSTHISKRLLRNFT